MKYILLKLNVYKNFQTNDGIESFTKFCCVNVKILREDFKEKDLFI